MSEPKTRATELHHLFPWLLHWSIEDERLRGFRSDAFAVRTGEGLVLVDPVPLAAELLAEFEGVNCIFMTHRNHQRSAWSLRRRFGATVHVPAGAAALDEEPDVSYDGTTTLPRGFQAVPATAFEGACYLHFQHPEGTRVSFCGDLICHDSGGPYRFPEQPGYFDPALGREDAGRLLALHPDTLCAAHAAPSVDGCREAFEGAISRA